MRWSIAFALALLSSAPALSAEPPPAPPPAPSTVTVASSAGPDGVRTLTHELVVPAPVDQVWEALTTAEGWMTWAVPLARPVAGKPDHFETSYNPQAAPGAADTIEHQWLARQAPHTARFRTVRTPAGFPHAEAYKQVVSTFTLTPEGAGTRVRLVSTGYPPGEAGDALVGFFTDGNRMTLEALAGRFRDGAKDWGKAAGG